MLLRAQLWVLFASVAVAQDRVALNTLSQIELRGHVLEITGTQKPSFTTFTLTDPPRLVIDFSESVLKGVPSELRVNNGTVTSVKTVAYGSAAAAIARVVIGFEKEAETEIWVEGMVLKIKIPWPNPEAKSVVDSGTLVASKDPVPMPNAERASADIKNPTPVEEAKPAATGNRVDLKAEKERLLQEKREAEKLAREEAAKKAAELKAEQERLLREKQEAEKFAREEAAKKAAELKAEKERLLREKQEAENLAREEATKKAAELKAEKDRLQREKREAEKLAREEAAKRAAEEKAEKERLLREKREAEKLAREEAAKRAADEKAEKERVKKAKAEADKLAKDEAAKRAADEKNEKERLRQEKVEAEKMARAEADAKAAEEKVDAQKAKGEKADAEKLARDEATKKAAQDKADRERITREAAQADLAAREASASRDGKGVAPSTTAGASPKSGEPVNMTGISFKQSRGAGKVSIRLSGTPRFGVREDRDRNVVVTLENARIILPNNERVLDTSFFDTAVAMIRPEAAQQSINVLIVLKQQVPYRVSQSGNEVSVDFEAPVR